MADGARYDLVVIGAGPGGYVAAIRAAQLGMNVACVEREPALGGTCLRIGCIPSKVLLESSEKYWEAKHELARHGVRDPHVELDLPAMLKRRDTVVATLTKGVEGLFRKNKVTRFLRTAPLTAAGPSRGRAQRGGTKLVAKYVVIATGSKPASLPGVELDGDRIGTSTEALSYSEVPKRLVVIGAGYIGIELRSVWNGLGASCVVEFLPRILPGMERQLARALRRSSPAGTRVPLATAGARCQDGREWSSTSRPADGRAESFDRVLVAVGRVPTRDLGSRAQASARREWPNPRRSSLRDLRTRRPRDRRRDSPARCWRTRRKTKASPASSCWPAAVAT